MADIITVAVEKGGVGKTTTVVNLAALMALDGKKTLVVDMETPANSTYMLTGIKKSQPDFLNKGVFDMFRSHGIHPTRDFISPTNIEGLDIIASNAQTPKAANQLQILADTISENEFLSVCLDEVRDDYDFIIIDTPPSRDIMTFNSIVASDYVLIPCKCDDFCLDSLSTTYELCNVFSDKENKDIKVIGILLTLVEKTALTQIIREDLAESEYGKVVLHSEIRKGQAVSDSTRFACPVVIHAKSSAPAKDYVSLYRELLERIGMTESEKRQ